jgi:hypothetical protein
MLKLVLLLLLVLLWSFPPLSLLLLAAVLSSWLLLTPLLLLPSPAPFCPLLPFLLLLLLLLPAVLVAATAFEFPLGRRTSPFTNTTLNRINGPPLLSLLSLLLWLVGDAVPSCTPNKASLDTPSCCCRCCCCCC